MIQILCLFAMLTIFFMLPIDFLIPYFTAQVALILLTVIRWSFFHSSTFLRLLFISHSSTSFLLNASLIKYTLFLMGQVFISERTQWCFHFFRFCSSQYLICSLFYHQNYRTLNFKVFHYLPQSTCLYHLLSGTMKVIQKYPSKLLS
jgi:hypothetical protein